jgi:hypothetical protein
MVLTRRPPLATLEYREFLLGYTVCTSRVLLEYPLGVPPWVHVCTPLNTARVPQENISADRARTGSAGTPLTTPPGYTLRTPRVPRRVGQRTARGRARRTRWRLCSADRRCRKTAHPHTHAHALATTRTRAHARGHAPSRRRPCSARSSRRFRPPLHSSTLRVPLGTPPVPAQYPRRPCSARSSRRFRPPLHSSTPEYP